jgi:hypothetical protein
MMIPRNVVLPTIILDMREIINALNMMTIPSNRVVEMLMIFNEFRYII